MTRALWPMPCGSSPVPAPTSSSTGAPSNAAAMAAAAVVLPMPISPRMTRSAPFWMARVDRAASGSEREGELLARHGRLLREVARAAPWLIHRYTGDSDARQRTGIDDSERHAQLACQHRDRRTAAGEVVQHLHRDVGRIGGDPCATMPWSPANSTIGAFSARGRSAACRAARRTAKASSTPSEPGGLVRMLCRASAVAPLCAHGSGQALSIHVSSTPPRLRRRSNCGAEWRLPPRRQGGSVRPQALNARSPARNARTCAPSTGRENR